MSDKITPRQWHQDRRIDRGVNSGALTAEETRTLRQGQREIDQAIRSARADGHVDARERQAIRGLQDAASRDIYELKHNEARRPDLVLHGPTDNPNPGPILQGPLDLARRPDLVLHGPTDNPNPGPILQGPLDLPRAAERVDGDRLARVLEDALRSARHENVRG